MNIAQLGYSCMVAGIIILIVIFIPIVWKIQRELIDGIGLTVHIVVKELIKFNKKS